MKRSKMWRKIAAVACSFALAASFFPMSALASPSSSHDVADTTITVSDVNSGDTVTAYLIADVDITAANNLVYTFASSVPAPYNSTSFLSQIPSDGYTFTPGTDMQEAAAAIAAAITSDTPYTQQVAATDSASLVLGSGYYLVRVTATSGTSYVYQNMIVNVAPQVDPDTGAYVPASNTTIDVKKSPVEISKTVGSEYTESTDKYRVGQEVPFKIETAVPSYPTDSLYATFVIGDQPTAGLSIDFDSIKINGTAASSFSGCTFATSGTGYTLTFAKDYILANAGLPITVTYNAMLTSDAFSVDSGDVTGNTATVEFNPNPYNNSTVKPHDITEVQTYGYVFPKVGETDGVENPLEGAVFTLYDENDEVVLDENEEPVTSTSTLVNGVAYVYFHGLSAGTYTAKETTVPAGFLKAPDQTFTLSATACTADNPATPDVTENNYLVSDENVVDPEAPDLPITGGAGTLAITGLGIILIAGAAALAARNRRKEEC